MENFARWKKRDYNDDDAALAVEGRFCVGGMARRSEGWTYVVDSFGDEIDEEHQEMKVNWYGHMLTYKRADFWQLVPEMPDDIRTSLVVFGLDHT